MLIDHWWQTWPWKVLTKSQIKKRNAESTSRVSRREMLRSVFWFEKRTRIFAKKSREICDHFSNVEKRGIFFLRDEKVKFTYHQSQSPFWVLTSKSRIKIVCWKIPSQKRNDHLSGSAMIIHYIEFNIKYNKIQSLLLLLSTHSKSTSISSRSSSPTSSCKFSM